MSKRISLREFQENLVRRLAEAKAGDHRGMLAIEAGKENWLIDLADSGEILPPPPLSSVPLTQSWYRGLANVRGTLYGVVDLSRFHDGPVIATGGPSRLLIVGARHDMHCALLVSRSSGLRNPEDFDSDTSSDTRPWVRERLRDSQERLWLRLDMTQLLSHPSFLDPGMQ